MVDSSISKAIDWLRFPMAFLVVMLHHSVGLFISADGVLRSLCIIFQEGICRLAVPCFFFISGFLFFNHLSQWDWNIWGHKLKTRVWTLLIPYVLWNIIAFLVFWGYANLTGSPTGLSQFFVDTGGIKIFWGVNGNIPIGPRALPIDIPLWFVRDLMLFSLLSPLVFCFLRATRLYGVLLLLACFLFVPSIVPEGFFFFVIGAAVQLSNRDTMGFALKHRLFFYIISFILLIAIVVLFDNEYWRRLVKNIFLVCGIAASFCAVSRLLAHRKVHISPFLVGSSFFIFATHKILILDNIATPIIDAILPKNGAFWPCLEFFLTPVFAVTLCLGLLFIMERFIPRTTKLLTGNRKVQVAKQSN